MNFIYLFIQFWFVENSKLKETNLLPALRMCSFLLNKSSEDELYKFIKSSLNYECVSRFNKLVLLQMFSKLPSLNYFTKTYIERWFTLFLETNCFLEVDYAFLYKLLTSSNLLITSEIEVFDAADAWISHKFEERSGYAKSLLLQVRFPLLSDCALKYILNKESSFKQVEECRTIIDDVLNNKLNYLQKPKNYITNRYCTQPVSTCEELISKYSVCHKGEVYDFDYSFDNDCNSEIVKYFPSEGTYIQFANLHNILPLHTDYSLCVLMNKIYLIGGKHYSGNMLMKYTNMCIEFNPKNCKWRVTNRMRLSRNGPSAVVFSGRIVVSGGKIDNNDNVDEIGNIDFVNHYLNEWEVAVTRTVEEYDPVSNCWLEFPSMIDGRAFHQSVAIRNNLFVFGGLVNKSEVYDSTCKMFARLKTSLKVKEKFLMMPCAAFTIGSKVFIFNRNNPSTVLCYDINNNTWAEKTYEIVDTIEEFSSIQVLS